MNIKTKTSPLFAITLAATLVTGCLPEEETGGETGDLYEDKGWTLVWSDEFEGAVLDTSKWAYEVNCWGGGNDESQCYVEDPDNVYLEDGILNIKAIREEHTGAVYNPDSPEYDPAVMYTKPFTSGRLRTVSPYDYIEGQDAGFEFRHDWKYGRIEIRAKVPSGQGTWAAAWMLPTDYEFGGWAMSGEIDILEAVNIGAQSDAPDAEVGDVENRIYGTLHYGRAWPGNEHSGESYAEIDPSADFHTYTVEWEEGAMRWFVDDVHYATQTQEGWYTHYQDEHGVWQTSGTTDAPFNQNFHIILNLAMGGAWAGNVNEGGIDASINEAIYQVDYVRVYQCEDDATGVACGTKGEEGTYALNSGVVEPLLPVAANFTADPMIMMDDSIRGDWQLAKWDGDGNDEYELVEDDAGNYLDLTFNGNGAMYFYGNEGSLTDFTNYAGGVMTFDIRIVEGNADGLTLGMSGPSLTGEGESAFHDIDISEMGLVGDSDWTTVTINMADIMATKPAFDYSEVGVPFKLVQYGGDLDLHVQIKDLQITQGTYVPPVVEVIVPTAPAVAPVIDDADAFVIYSDANTVDQAISDYQSWWNPPLMSDQVIDGNNFLKFQIQVDAGSGGLVLGSGADTIDASAYTGIRFDMFVEEGVTNAQFKMVSSPANEGIAIPVTAKSEWVSVEIPFSDFTVGAVGTLDTSDLGTMGVILLGTPGASVYIDNIMFTNFTPAVAVGPTEAAPTPTEAEANVISIFSDAYTDVAGTDFNPNWGQATGTSQVDVAGNNTLKYANLNYQGTQFGAAQDVSGKTSVHVDFWTADATALELFLISNGPVEFAYALPITQNEWVSADIPLSSFTGVDLADVIQFKVVGNGTVFLDNLYFH